MKILWLVLKYFDISLDKSTRIGMIKSLMSNGHDTVILTGFKNNSNKIIKQIKLLPSIKIKWLHFITLNFIMFIEGLKYIVKYNYKIIICCHMSPITGLFLKLCTNLLGSKTIFILDVRTIPVETTGFSGKIIEKIFYINIKIAKWFFNGITVIGFEMRKYIINKYHIDRKIIGIWSSAVDVEIFNPHKLNHNLVYSIKSKINPDDKFVVMYHGTITENRGLLQTIEAMRLINFYYSNIILIIIGDGRFKDKLKHKVAQFKLNDVVKIIDTQQLNDIPNYIVNCDVGIIPLPDIMWWRVSSPIKLMEYLAMGKPVIVSDIAAHRIVLDKIKGVYYLRNTTPEQIKNSIIASYNNRHNFIKYSNKLRNIVITNYTWDQQAGRLINYLCKIS